MLFKRLNDWLNLRDLDKALDEARTSVIARYSRGNVSVQNGGVIDEYGLETLQRQGDCAVIKIQRSQQKHSPHGEPTRVRF